MSGTTPPPGSGPGEEENPYAQPGQGRPPEQPWQSTPPPSGPPAWSGPADGGSWGDPAPVPTLPDPMSRAVMLMKYAGPALQLIGVVLTFVRRDTIRDTFADQFPNYSTSELDGAVNASLTFAVVVGAIGIALWLWMAAKNGAGRSWARVVATVLGGLNILFTILSLNAGDAIVLVINIASIVVAGWVLYLLYRPESSQYYAAVKAAGR